MNPPNLTDLLHPHQGPDLTIPMAMTSVAAGFPSPAEDYTDQGLDLSRHFIRHPQASFMMRISGDSLMGVGIRPGDYAVVDRSKEARDGSIVVAVVDGEFTAKRYQIRSGLVELVAEHPGYPPIPWNEGCEIWGVVTSVHRDLLTSG